MMKFDMTLLLFIVLGYFSMTVSATPTELDCLIQPGMYVDLSSPIDTTVEEILVKPGDTVTKGQTLVQLESSVESVRVMLATIQASSTTEIQDRKTQLKYIRLNNQRINNLYAKKSVSEYERDKSATELALATLELDKARENAQIANVNLQLAKTLLALKTLKSPINGIVVDIYTQAGESVVDRPIMNLAQINPLKVELIASTEYFGLITPGMAVKIQPELPKNKHFKATVTVVDQLIDPASGTFTVRMALPNPNDILVAGVNCLASLDFDLTTPLDNIDYAEVK
jgi:RND family efflux transporter MFP subunit